MSYLVEGQRCFAKINHACFSHSTPAKKKSLSLSPVSEREKVGSCQFDTVSRIFALWQRVKWVTNTDPVSVLWQLTNAEDTCWEVTACVLATSIGPLAENALLLWHLHKEQFNFLTNMFTPKQMFGWMCIKHLNWFLCVRNRSKFNFSFTSRLKNQWCLSTVTSVRHEHDGDLRACEETF